VRSGLESWELEWLAGELRAGGEDLLRRLIGKLDGAGKADAASICEALGLLGPDAKSALPALEAIANRRGWLGRPREAGAARAAIIRIRGDEPEFILDALRSGQDWLRPIALEAMADWPRETASRHADEMAEALEPLLGATDLRLIGQALRALSHVGPGHARVEVMVARKLAYPSASVMRAAAAALRDICPRTPEIVAPLTGVLRMWRLDPAMGLEPGHRDGLPWPADPRWMAESRRRVRSTAIWALGFVGAAAEGAVPVVLEHLASGAASLRQTAATALGGIGVASPEVVDALTLTCREDRTPAVCRAAAGALGRLRARDAEVLAALRHALADIGTRKSAAWALGQIRPPAAGCASALVAAADSNRDRRRVVTRALVRMGPETVPALIDALGSRERWPCVAAAEALAELRAEEALPALEKLVDDGRADVRAATQQAVTRIGSQRRDR